MNTFDCESVPEFHGRVKPRFWEGWNAWKRSLWIRAVNVAGPGQVPRMAAGDALEAMRLLQAMGEWVEVPAESLPAMAPAPRRSPVGHHGRPAGKAAGKGGKVRGTASTSRAMGDRDGARWVNGAGRQDRLAGYDNY